MRARFTRYAVVLVVLALAGAACSNNDKAASTKTPSSGGSATSKAADLRAALGTLLGEHVVLASQATGAALGGRTKEFDAAAGVLLGKNTDDLTAAISSVYGAGAAEQFKGLWKKHIGFVVTYTSNFGNKTVQDKAVADLIQYTKDFGAFLGAATGLPTDAVAELVKEHILTLKTVIDDQYAKNYAKAYGDTVTAIGHMDMIARALADAIAKQKGF